MAISLKLLRSQCPGLTRQQLLFFQAFQVLHTTEYNTQSQTIHAEKDRKQENKKMWKR